MFAGEAGIDKLNEESYRICVTNVPNVRIMLRSTYIFTSRVFHQGKNDITISLF